MDIQLQFVLLGLVVGVMVGLTGMGGGSLMAPLLILGFKVQPVVAVGTDLVYMAVTKLVGAWQHHRQENVDFRLVALLATGSIPGALVGLLVLSLLPDQLGISGNALVTRLLAGVLLLVGISLLFFKKVHNSPLTDRLNRKAVVPVLGALVGFLVALTSVGSGSLFLVLMITLYALPLRRIVGTDVFHGFILVAVAGMGHIWVGNVDFPLVASLVIGSVPGVIIGSRLTMVLSERKLSTAVGVVLLSLGVRLMI